MTKNGDIIPDVDTLPMRVTVPDRTHDTCACCPACGRPFAPESHETQPRAAMRGRLLRAFIHGPTYKTAGAYVDVPGAEGEARRVTRQVIESAYEDAPDGVQEAVELRVWASLSTPEAAALMGISPSEVRRKLAHFWALIAASAPRVK